MNIWKVYEHQWNNVPTDETADDDEKVDSKEDVRIVEALMEGGPLSDQSDWLVCGCGMMVLESCYEQHNQYVSCFMCRNIERLMFTAELTYHDAVHSHFDLDHPENKYVAD